MSNVIRGSTNLPTWTSREISSVDGVITTTLWFEGLQSDMASLFLVYHNDGWDAHLKEINSIWNLQVVTSDPTEQDIVPELEQADETPRLNYDISTKFIKRSILTPFHPMYRKLRLKDRLILKDFMDDPTKYATASPALSVDNSVEAAFAWEMFAMLSTGTTTFNVKQPTLTVQYNCSDNYNIIETLSNDNKILSTATLISQEDVPSNIQGLMPNSGDPDPLPGDDFPWLQLGWLQHPIQVVHTLNTLRQVSQEFTYDLYPIYNHQLDGVLR